MATPAAAIESLPPPPPPPLAVLTGSENRATAEAILTTMTATAMDAVGEMGTATPSIIPVGTMLGTSAAGVGVAATLARLRGGTAEGVVAAVAVAPEIAGMSSSRGGGGIALAEA